MVFTIFHKRKTHNLLFSHICFCLFVVTDSLGLSHIKSKSKSLLLSHHHSTSALVSEILISVLQTVQKKQQTIYIWTDSAKKTTNNLHMDRQCKKTALEHLQCSRQCKKNNKQFTYGQTVQKQQQQFTYGQYIFTDCTEDNVQNTHTYTQYT